MDESERIKFKENDTKILYIIILENYFVLVDNSNNKTL